MMLPLLAFTQECTQNGNNSVDETGDKTRNQS